MPGAFACAAAVFLAGSEWAVQRSARGRVYGDGDGLPPAAVALVLGASRTLADGRANAFYEARLDLAAELFREGRVRGLIVSGDNSRADYNEPDDMKADLVARGVPARFVTCDYAGFRTLDSVQRVHRVFRQDRVIIVSQRFHAERALYLARAEGLDATACAAADAARWWQVRARLREVLARGAAVLDVALGRGPKFLGAVERVELAGAD
ncbi:MAG: ElyC/SanA/YdcF family protein [Opitutaceae bacterium]